MSRSWRFKTCGVKVTLFCPLPEIEKDAASSIKNNINLSQNLTMFWKALLNPKLLNAIMGQQWLAEFFRLQNVFNARNNEENETLFHQLFLFFNLEYRKRSS